MTMPMKIPDKKGNCTPNGREKEGQLTFQYDWNVAEWMQNNLSPSHDCLIIMLRYGYKLLLSKEYSCFNITNLHEKSIQIHMQAFLLTTQYPFSENIFLRNY